MSLADTVRNALNQGADENYTFRSFGVRPDWYQRGHDAVDALVAENAQLAERVRELEQRVAVVTACGGGAECDAPLHVHGCFADLGNCDRPGEHRADS